MSRRFQRLETYRRAGTQIMQRTPKTLNSALTSTPDLLISPARACQLKSQLRIIIYSYLRTHEQTRFQAFSHIFDGPVTSVIRTKSRALGRCFSVITSRDLSRNLAIFKSVRSQRAKTFLLGLEFHKFAHCGFSIPPHVSRDIWTVHNVRKTT